MPTTTNFGWTTPADTDLVKDGAAAIRTLAGNIDTSLVDLKGGTTGQVLSKASGTDLDFSFTTIPAGALNYITSASPSAVATISIDNCFTSTYRNYLIVTNLECTASGGYLLTARLRASGTDNTSTNYKYNLIYMGSNANTVNGDNNGSATSFAFAETRETGETSATTYVYSPQASVETTFTTNSASLGATNSAWSLGGGSMTVTTSYDGFTLAVGSGTFTGTIRVYGVANS